MEYFKNFQPRVYQETIFAKSLSANSLVVLPTGLGKTAISLMLAVARLKALPNSKILILAPTRPLVHQHLETFTELLNPQFLHPDALIVFTGQVKSEQRQQLWKEATVIFSTPQGLENDILSRKIVLDDVSLLVFDEAHRATGDYSYVWVANQYVKQAKNPRILALTASPGDNTETIQEVCKNLHIHHIESRTKESPDVAPYVQETDIRWIEVKLPDEILNVLKPLQEMVAERIKKIQSFLTGMNPRLTNPRYVGKKDILALQAKLQGSVGRQEYDPALFEAISTTAQILKLQHATELLETQGPQPALTYLEDVVEQGKKGASKAVIVITRDQRFISAISILREISSTMRHPKIPKLVDIILNIIEKKPTAKLIVFNNYRDSITYLKSLLDEHPAIKAATFVGQAKKRGLGNTQKEQLQLIRDFKDGVYNVLIMSSVGEEGLDIPSVDAVIFYEPVPSMIRQIQRAGRTGRHEKGEIIILIAKGTRDEAYRWSTHTKQKRMYDMLDKTQATLDVPKVQMTLEDIKPPEPEKQHLKIVVDSREKANRIVKHFVDEKVHIEVQQLPIGDYILTHEVGVEFKTKQDFVDSILDGRLLAQAAGLTRAFPKPLIVVQGEEDIFALRNVHPNAIIGALSTLAVSFRLPVLFTRNEMETFQLFMSIVKKQEKSITDFSAHAVKPKSDDDLQKFIIEALPTIGPSAAEELLKHFKTVERIMTASEEELTAAPGIGKIRAKKIREIVTKSYLS